jgi:ZIP family zinc transporter
MFAVVAGIMIYIAIEELIPSSRQYGYDRPALIATFAGICLMPLTFFF